MPLSINVGLSRKASRDYQSTGVSINIVAELDQTLLARPDELQQQIDGLYQQAQEAIDRNAASSEPQRQQRNYQQRSDGPRNGRRDSRNGGGNGNGNNGGAQTMTLSQRKAILSIADRNQIDLDIECREFIGQDFDELSIRQASDLIDHLKSLHPAGNGNGR